MSQHAPPRGGAAGVVFLIAIVLGGAGLAFDLLHHQRGFWLGAEPGARAVIGAAAAVIVIAAAHGVRLLLGRAHRSKEGGDGDHP